MFDKRSIQVIMEEHTKSDFRKPPIFPWLPYTAKGFFMSKLKYI